MNNEEESSYLVPPNHRISQSQHSPMRVLTDNFQPSIAFANVDESEDGNEIQKSSGGKDQTP